MANKQRLFDANEPVGFLKEQRVKETGAFSKGVNKGLNIAISALRNAEIAPTVDAVKWIPVTERLPDKKENDWVLISIRLMPEDYDGVPCVAELRKGKWYDDQGGLLDTPEEGCGVIVTH